MDPTAEAGTSSGCGLTQITRDVIYPYLYKYGQKHGFAEAALVQRTRLQDDDTKIITIKYGLRDENARAIIASSCKNPEFAAIIGAEYMWDIAIHLQKVLNKKQLTADVAYAGYVFGKNGAIPLLKAFFNPHHQKYAAKDLASDAAVKANPALFFLDPDTKKHPTTVQYLAKTLREKVGHNLLPTFQSREDFSFKVASAQP